MKPETKKSIFISYARGDNRAGFVQWLTFALDLYADVYWDGKLQAEPWRETLLAKIRECEFFGVVMSQRQGRSDICQLELNEAKKYNKRIIPIKVFHDYYDKELSEGNWVDFTGGRDKGFGELTYFMYDQKFNPWDYLYELNEQELLSALGAGLLPAIIAKEIADWILVNQFWYTLEHRLRHFDQKIHLPKPRTPYDIWKFLKHWMNQEQYIQEAIISTRNDAIPLIEIFVVESNSIHDNDHVKAGKYALDVFTSVTRYVQEIKFSGGESELMDWSDTHVFNTVSKLRELILIHARRSRYLY